MSDLGELSKSVQSLISRAISQGFSAERLSLISEELPVLDKLMNLWFQIEMSRSILDSGIDLDDPKNSHLSQLIDAFKSLSNDMVRVFHPIHLALL